MNHKAQLEQLTRYLTGLPLRDVRKLALALERQRSLGNGGFPNDAILNILRPSLAAMRMPRIMTPQRVLCAPFEDLLRPDDPDVKQIGLVSRATIAEMWRLLHDLQSDTVSELCESYTQAQTAGDHRATDAISRQLWRLAADVLKRPLAAAEGSPDTYREFAKSVGGSRRAEDLKEIQAVLTIAEQVEHVKALLPRKPIRGLSDDDVTLIARVYEELASRNQEQEIFLLMVVLGRLDQKFELMKVIRNFSPKMDDTLATRTDLRTAGDLVINALENDAEEIRSAAGDSQDEDGFMQLVRRYATNSNGITSEIGIRRDGDWGQRMYACRADVSEAIEQRLLAAAPPRILSALPNTGGPKGTVVAAPDFGQGMDEAAYRIAERRARAVSETARMAEQLGVTNTASQAVESVKRELNRYGKMLLERLSKISAAETENATNHLYVTVRLTELMSNSKEADLLRRRGLEGLGERIKPQPDADDSLQAIIRSGRAMEILRPDVAE